MNKRLWYINISLAVLLALVCIGGLAGIPGYPSSARFDKSDFKSSTDTNSNTEVESVTITSSRGFSNWLNPPPAYGSIKVTIEPAEAASTGGSWRVGGNSWLESGQKAEKITPGEKNVTFKTLKGWLSPTVTAKITKDQLTEITATYTIPPQGYVKVNITPESILEQSPQWQIDNGQWLGNGEISQKVAVGSYKMAFKQIDGWDSPEISVSIEDEKTTEITAEYKLIYYGYINLKLLDSPQPENIQWQIAGGQWLAFGSEPQKVRLGEYTVNFNKVPDWDSPAPITLNVEEEKTYDLEVSYQPIPYAQVTVKILPENDERMSPAQWKIDSMAWNNFNQTDSKVTMGTHKISFKEVGGWQTPPAIDIDINEEKTYEYICEYTRIKPAGPKFVIRSVIETGGGNGVAFTSPKIGYKVGEEIDGYKLIHVEYGKVILEKEGFEYELEVIENGPLKQIGDATTPPANRPTPPGRDPREGRMPDNSYQPPVFNRTKSTR